MSLQKRLAVGISTVLAVILVFMGLASISFWEIEGFITSILPKDIAVARTYERFTDEWSNLFEKAEDALNSYNSKDIYFSPQKIDQLESNIQKLKNLVVGPERKENLKTVSHMATSFIKKLKAFELLLKRRNNLVKKKSAKRNKAAKQLISQLTSLLSSYKSMLGDINKILQDPEFNSENSGAVSLKKKIANIQKDLVMAEEQLRLYIDTRKNQQEHTLSPSLKRIANNVEARLRSIIYALEISQRESTRSVHKRILSKTKTKISSFFNSFQNLRNLLDAPESEVIGINNDLQNSLDKMEALWKKGILKSSAEAEIFWKKIFVNSDQLTTLFSRDYKVILIFLAIVFIAGVYFNFTLPKKIGGPLKQLNREIENFRLGNNISDLSISHTEEIDALVKAFQLMANRLNLQGEVNRNYLESIHSLTQVFRELHETKKRLDSPNERIEKAINRVLQQLIAQVPDIDLVKVMVLANDKDSSKINFIRLGDPEFSERFKKSEEYLTYCSSVGWNPDDSTLSHEEIIPSDLGLTGWYFENNPGIKTGAEDNSFFKPIYAPQSISQNPILANRQFETGLNGCLVTEPLVVPEQEDDEEYSNRGILFVYYLDQTIKLSWQEIFFIQIIASQISSIIETDNLLQEHDLKKKMDTQLTMAREIQENLLPQNVPVTNGLRISKISKSAAEVGGDYYDFFELDNNRLGVVIADASGKNVPAAIIMTVFKTTLSTMDLSIMDPSEVLTRANKIIAKNITNDRFITAMYVIINAETGEVELSSAGHNPAFVVSGRGMGLSLHEKNVKCIPLGILEDYPYETIKFKLDPNDLLFLYTDGVTEARNASEEEFDVSGLKKFLARPRGKNPTADLLREIENFSKHANQHDDITAVSVEFKGDA